MDLYRQAEFPGNSDFLVVDKLIHGCTNLECKRKLMAKARDVSVKDCLDLMRKFEAVDVTMKRLEESTESKQIGATYKDPTRKSQSRGSKHLKKSDSMTHDNKTCSWCGGHSHPREKCPAKDVRCRFCGKDGHFEKACFRKKHKTKHKVRKKCIVGTSEPEASEYESEDDLGVQSISVESINASAREIIA